MKIVFPFIGQQNLGIESLSAMLKFHGHQTYLAFDPGLFDDKFYFAMPRAGKIFSSKPKLIDEIVDLKPDLLAFCVFSESVHWALEIAAAVKARWSVPVIFGGPHATEAPEHTLKNSVVDYICRAEGEYALLELVERLKGRQSTDCIKNIWTKDEQGTIIQNPVRPADNNDLDRLPLPDKTLFAQFMDYGSLYGMMSARGCPYQCTFCSAPVLKDAYREVGSKSIRFGELDRIFQELHEAQKVHKLRYIRFYDDVFTAKVERVLAFSERYRREIHLPFIVSTHPQMLNEVIVKALKEAGCHAIEIGIQSMSEHIRKTVLKRPETDKAIENTIRLCKKYGLRFYLDHIFGFPSEPESSQQLAFENYLRWKPGRVQTFWLTLLPGTEIVKMLKADGKLTDEEVERLFNGFVKNYHDYGIVEDPEERKILKNYEILFKLVPVFPRRWVSQIYQKGIFRSLYHSPKWVCWILDIAGAIRNSAPEHRAYAQYYWKNGLRFLIGGSLIQESTYPHRAGCEEALCLQGS